MADDELPRDAEGYYVLPCGCRMKTAVVMGKPTFLFKPHALDCEFYAYVRARGRAAGQPAQVIDLRGGRDG